MIAAHNQPTRVASIHHMKTLRITTAKTRKGIITWLAKANPFNHYLMTAHFDQVAVAVYVHKYTGAIHGYDNAAGHFYDLTHRRQAIAA